MSKKFIIVVLLNIVLAGFLSADPILWDPDGVVIREGVNIEWQRSMTEIASGEVIHVWSDTRTGKRDLYAQAVDENGVVWTQSVVVDAKPDRQEDPMIVASSDGNAIIAWIDFSLHPIEGGVYAQKIDAQGNLLWGDGVEVCSAPGIQISLNMVPNNEGGAYIIWQDSRLGSIGIYGVHLDADGNLYPGWEVDGNALANEPASDQTNHTFWEDGENGSILAYVTNESGTRDIKAIRILEDGSIDWTIWLANHPGYEQQYPRIAPLSNGNFGFAWQDKSFNGTDLIAVQIIDINGNNILPEPAVIFEQFSAQHNPRVTMASDDGFFVCWEDYRNHPEQRDLYIQKVSSQGDFLWETEGTAVTNMVFSQRNPRLIGDSDGGVIVTWDDRREGDHPHVDIYAQHFDSTGNALWEENGKPVAVVPGEALGSNVKISNDHIFISWADHRQGSKGLYSQVYDLEGNELFDENGIQVYWGLSGDTDRHVTIEDTDGTYIIWDDTRGLSRQIFLQKVFHDGTTLFPENGIPVTGDTGYGQERPNALLMEDGTLVVSWEEQRGANREIYIQAIDNQGNQLWETDGLKPYEDISEYITSYRLRMAPDGAGGIFLAWNHIDEAASWYESIHAQRIVDGQRIWPGEGIIIQQYISGPPLTELNIHGIIDGIFLYSDKSNARFIRAKRIDLDGNTWEGWDEEGLTIADFPPTIAYQNPRIYKIDQHYYIFWEHRHQPEGDITLDIYGQKINGDGDKLWEDDGKIILELVEDIEKVNFTFCESYIYSTWTYAINSVGVHKIDFEGNSIWEEDYLFVSQDNHEKDSPQIKFINNKLFLTWVSSSGLTIEDNTLFMQLINAQTGNFEWNSEGYLLSDAPKQKSRPQITRAGEEDLIIVWNDGRTSGKEDIWGLYAQKITTFVSNTSDKTVLPAKMAKLHQNYPNPFNPSTNISFSLKEYNPVSLTVFNIKGQSVIRLINNEYLQPGTHSINWNGQDSYGNKVGSGIFFYRLETKGTSETRKMLLLK